MFQHMANCTCSITAAGGNDVTLGPFLLLLLEQLPLPLERPAHFWRALMVAHESGLSHRAPGLRSALGV